MKISNFGKNIKVFKTEMMVDETVVGHIYEVPPFSFTLLIRVLKYRPFIFAGVFMKTL